MTSAIECTSETEWNEYVLNNGGHPLQLWGWGEVKLAHGWQVRRVFIGSQKTDKIGAVQILTKSLPWPFRSFSYVPRGPVCPPEHRIVVLAALRDYVKSTVGSFAISVEPDWSSGELGGDWRRARTSILIPQTVRLDLSKTEEDLQSVMSKKTRQYVRKSQKEALTIRQVKGREEIEACFEIYKQTAERAQFDLHNWHYYDYIYQKLGDHSPIFAAFSRDVPVAFVWLVTSEAIAFELYGGMNDEGQQLRANYALKWFAIQKMKQWGVATYDMNGLLNDGVSSFKRGFTDHDTNLIGSFDAPLSPLYSLWTYGLPLMKKLVRRSKALLKR